MRNETDATSLLMGTEVLAKGSNQETTEMRYLLGTLSPEDESRLEDAFFADDTKFAELELAEADLIDAYVQQLLSPQDQKRFELKLRASPPLLERVKFARVLNEKASDSLSSQKEVFSPSDATIRRKPGLRWWDGFLLQPVRQVAMAAGVVMVGGVALLIGWQNLRHEANQLASDQAEWEQQRRDRDLQSTAQLTEVEQRAAALQRERDQLADDRKRFEESQRTGKQTNTGTAQPFVATLATILLRPESLRSGDSSDPVLAIGPNTTVARVQLALEKTDYPAYNVVVKTVDEVEVFRKNGLKPRRTGSGHQLLLSIPSELLPRDTYTVHVDGVPASGQVESVSDYAFRIIKK